jgi:hypothetical protein
MNMLKESIFQKKYNLRKWQLSACLFFVFLCLFRADLHGQLDYKAAFTPVAPIIDGIGDEPCWETVEWFPIDVEWFNNAPPITPDVFSGRFKAVWTLERLYLLVEIVDDTLVQHNSDPLSLYWEDDCLEIFIDEDRSGGDHKYNHNAFAYHISAITKKIVDIDVDKKPKLFNHHADVGIRKEGTTYTWEIGLWVYGDDYKYGKDNTPLQLFPGKEMGFSLAYCDNHGNGRENFIGTEPGGLDSWKDAGLFGKMELISPGTSTNTIQNESVPHWQVYPNPVGRQLNIVPPAGNSEEFSIKLLDMSGRVLNTQQFCGQFREYIAYIPENYQGDYFILKLISATTEKNMIIMRNL